MREEATGSGFAFGRQRYRNWPTRCRSRFRSVNSLHGTSKWNKIEHRLFSFISQNWRGKPLISHAVIVKLITATRTKTGLKVKARLDTNSYPGGIKVRRADIEGVKLRPDSFHGDWNYTILPTTTSAAKN